MPPDGESYPSKTFTILSLTHTRVRVKCNFLFPFLHIVFLHKFLAHRRRVFAPNVESAAKALTTPPRGGILNTSVTELWRLPRLRVFYSTIGPGTTACGHCF